MKKVIAVLLFVILAAIVAVQAADTTDSPTTGYIQSWDATSMTNVRSGALLDSIDTVGPSGAQRIGIPVQPQQIEMFGRYLGDGTSTGAPLTADVDYYVTTVATGTGTTAQLLSLLRTQKPDYTRNVTATMSGATTATLVIKGIRSQLAIPAGQNYNHSETLTWSAATGAKVSAGTFDQIISATLTNGEGANNVNITVGFGDVFGLKWPFYSDFTAMSDCLFDATGNGYANTAMTTVTFVAGDPTGTGDKIGTVTLTNPAPNGNGDNNDRIFTVTYLATDTFGVPNLSQPGTRKFDD